MPLDLHSITAQLASIAVGTLIIPGELKLP